MNTIQKNLLGGRGNTIKSFAETWFTFFVFVISCVKYEKESNIKEVTQQGVCPDKIETITVYGLLKYGNTIY